MAIPKHRLENKLEREQWLTTILSSINDAAIVTDEINCITLLNPAAELLTGWKQEEVLGKNVTEVLQFTCTATFTAQVNLDVDVLAPTILIAKNGTQLSISKNIVPIKDEQGHAKGTVVIFRNIAERIETEQVRILQARAEQLEIQMAELERLNHLKDDFLSTVSHELRTPMANIRMAVKMLEISLKQMREITILSPQVEVGERTIQRYLQILKDECSREIELIENILDLQRLEAGGQTFSSEVIDLESLLLQLVEPFRERAKERQQTLQLNFPKNLNPIISDTASIGRIVAELLNNACKYTPLKEAIALNVKTIADKIQLQVCNTGVEIPAKELAHVFEKFYRVPSNDPWKQGGTGLGLALVQKLCEQLGGSILAESRDKMTCFTVELPIVFQ